MFEKIWTHNENLEVEVEKRTKELLKINYHLEQSNLEVRKQSEHITTLNEFPEARLDQATKDLIKKMKNLKNTPSIIHIKQGLP